MALSLVAAPATEPLTIAEARAHVKLDDSAGEPSPATAPTVALAGAGAGLLENGVHRLAVSYVTADGETPPGPLSAPITVVDKSVNGKIAVAVIPAGGSAVLTIKLWKPLVGTVAPLFYAGSVANGLTTAILTLADASLGAQAPTTNTTADPELVQWITAARQYVETFTHRALITQTWDLQLEGFPWQTLSGESSGLGTGAILIPKPPLQLTPTPPVITYVDMQGVTQTWDPTLYTVDAPQGPTARKGRIVPAYFQIYPVTRWVPNAVTVRFVAGYGNAAAVPAPIKSAMKLLIGNWWVNREAGQIIRGSADILPFGVEPLLWPFKAF